MGIYCFSCAQKAAEIFHIREMLYKKRESGLGFAGKKTTVMTIATTKKLLLLSTLLGITCLFSSNDFLSQCSPFTSQKLLPIWPWFVSSYSSPLEMVYATSGSDGLGASQLGMCLSWAASRACKHRAWRCPAFLKGFYVGCFIMRFSSLTASCW